MGAVEDVALWKSRSQKMDLLTQGRGVEAACGRPKAVPWHRSVRARWGH